MKGRSKRGEDYAEYLASPHWTAKRLEALMHYGHACQLCGIPRNLDVHHVTYKRRGAELLADLRILCRPCHYSIHEAVATIAGGNRTHPKHLRRVTDAAIFNATRWRPPREDAPKRKAKRKKDRARRYTPEEKRQRDRARRRAVERAVSPERVAAAKERELARPGRRPPRPGPRTSSQPDRRRPTPHQRPVKGGGMPHSR